MSDESFGTESSGDAIVFHPIGVVRSEHNEPKQTPIQPRYADGCKGRLEIRPEYADGLKDLDGFSHLILLYHFHKARGVQLQVVPFTDTQPRGLFSTRFPRRPNPIGISIVRLDKVEGNVVHISGVDILDGTPLLDIKPLVPRFDLRDDIVNNARGGWTETVTDEFAAERGRRDYRGVAADTASAKAEKDGEE